MKDLRLFTGADEIGWLRVDSISGEGNLTVMETYNLDDRLKDFDPEGDNYALKVELSTNFMKLPKTFGDVIEFATDNSLTLLSQDSKSTSIIVGGVSITTDSPVTAGTINVAYAGDTIETSGDSGSVEFSVSSGALPAGLALNKSTGAITGTPTEDGTFDFTITVFDTVYQASVSKAFQIVIAGA